MPVSVSYQFPIIHNRHKYKAKKAKYPLKCYEWTRSRVSWETMLVFLVIPDDSARVKKPNGEYGAQRPGLAIHQTVEIVTELYGDKPDHQCGTDTLIFEEVLPVPPGGGAFGQLAVVSHVYDPHAAGFAWLLGCQVTPPQLCRIVSNVTSTVKLVVATIRGEPINESLAEGEFAVLLKGTRIQEGKGNGVRNEGTLPGNSNIKVEELAGQKSATHKYKADVEHCAPFQFAGLDPKRHPETDITAGEVPDDLKPPVDIERAVDSILAGMPAPVTTSHVALGRPATPMFARSAVPPAHATLGRAFLLRHAAGRRPGDWMADSSSFG